MNKIGFIGMGNMAMALAAGFLATGKVRGEEMCAFAPNQDKLRQNAQSLGFSPRPTALAVAEDSDVVIMACKPYQIEGVLAQIGEFLPGKALVSVAAGWVHSTFFEILGEKVRIQCIMPNTPAMVGEGVMLFEQKNSLLPDELSELKDLFSSLGLVEMLPTELMGIGGAVSGCGPAFMDLIMEAYADAAVKYGVSREVAYRIVSQTMLGSAKLQQVTKKHPGVLKDEVCSPRGTTIRGVDSLEKNGVRGALISSIDVIMDMKK